MIGQIFGLLTVIAPAPQKTYGRTRWLVSCSCGSPPKIVAQADLRSGATKGCGCLRNGEWLFKHGDSHSKEHNAWVDMLKRCTNKDHKDYKNYGAKGIHVCSEWLESYQKFLEHVGRAPSKKHSIDRINNSKGYEPGNCRWATKKTQNQNRKSTIWVKLKEEKYCLKEFCEINNLPYKKIKAALWKRRKKRPDINPLEVINLYGFQSS